MDNWFSKMGLYYLAPNGKNCNNRGPRIVYIFMLLFLLFVKHGTCNEFEIDIPEGVPAQTVIATIPELVTSAKGPYTFIYSSGVGVESDLDMNRNTGIIKTKVELDRETRDHYKVIAFSNTGTVQVNIQVIDINDNSPTFAESVIKKSLPETTPRDVKIHLGSATDPDLGINRTQGYEIVSGNTNNAFKLAVKRAENGVLFLDLLINGELDYEETQHYNLSIRAYDGGVPPRYGTLLVDITIQDTNDNQPIFNQSRYFTRVKENATVGSTVLQVFATDRDSGENGKIAYSIDRQRSDPEEKFGVNPSNGIVFVNGQLDYETKQNYELIVIAADNGTQKLQTTAIVSIQVDDVNDNEPIINIKFFGNSSGHILESLKPNDYLASISVSDPDVPDYDGKVNVSLQGGGGHFGLVTSNNVVFLVVLSLPLDREKTPSYTLTVVATDSGDPPLTAKKSITIKVVDVNDNAPVFSKSTYYADIQEIVPPGSSVYQVTATDKDMGENARITYKIFHTPDTHSDWFQIDNKTGLITTKSKLDCETAAEPRLLIQAMDNGKPRLSSNTTVVVRIMDVNDNQPVFHQSFYNVTVAENAGIQKCILTVEAVDPDCGANAKVTYSIATNLGFQYPTEFEIKQDSGEVCVIKPLDYEIISSYEFPAKAQDQNGLHTTAMIKITVEDVNDNRPVFYPTNYTVNINVNSPIGTEVAIVHATDKDSGKWGSVQYQFVSGNTQNIFAINTQTGVITFNKLVSTQGVYTLLVQASDGGGLISAVNANVTISVVPANQRPATFSETLYKWTVLESMKRNDEIGTVSATGPGGQSVSYSIVSGDPLRYFSIHPTSGVITINTKLDADTHPFVLLSLQARAGSPPSYGRAQANITILDVNDNYPQFTRSYIEIPVKEDTSLTEVIYVVQATDKDSGLNGQVRYSVTQGQSFFTVNTESGQLKLRQKLDYETAEKHNVKVMAFDLGKPSMNSTMSLIIDVQDVNDNKPAFNQSHYSMRIYESIALNTKFGRVFATDKDSGNNARITYRLSENANMDTFGIFADDGFIYNKIKLDREKNEKYNFEVLAIDNGIPSKTATATVSINVMDTNDNSPEFNEKSYHFDIQEEKPRLSYVGTVSAYDPDQANSDHLRYSIFSRGSGNPNFRINELSGVIETMLPVDREAQDTYEFVVSVTDGGIPPRESTVPVKINILDINDNAPVFQHQGFYQTSIKENEPKGTPVIQVSAYDKDKGENRTITYSIFNVGQNSDGQKFAINSQSGWITTNEVYNHETKKKYIFSVQASDGGNPPKKDIRTVEVIITDINESPPVFPTKSMSLSVEENTLPGTKIGFVKAHDKDSGENGRVNYYIVNGNAYGTFGVNRSTGQLFVASQVDYEVRSQYSITIRAIDNSNINPMSSIINVNITVVDLNDNAPVFDEDPITFHIPENTRQGEHVRTFSATDRDSSHNGNSIVHYTIVNQSPNQNWFEIEPTTGVLKTLRVIDYEETHMISITVRATDQPINVQDRLSSTVTALIMIDDVNDNSPIFRSSPDVHVMEDEPIGYPVVYVLATDTDSKQNGYVTYSLMSGNEDGHFKLDSISGRLMIVKMLDRETTKLLHLNISASDHGYPRKSTYQLLSIHVEDVNDNPPVFDHSVYTANVTENGDIGELVTQIHATDKDIGDNGKVSYLIPYGIADNKFSVNSVSGEIRTNASLNREEHDSLIITAYARDGSFPALYDTTTVLINILDDNDNYPVFKNPNYNLEVPENAAVSIIHSVHAHDADIGKNGDITYAIVGGNVDNKFSINSKSGAISCNPLDREMHASYELEIEASDGGTPPKRNTSRLLIKVLDDNDNNPSFVRKEYSVSIKEDVAVGTSLLKIEAHDLDTGINSLISYSLDNDAAGQFKIDNVTGVIKSDGAFDREKTAQYTFQAHAIDAGLYGPRSDKVSIKVKILDVNDNPPVFDKIPYKANISQNYIQNQYVTKVNAEDKDSGENGEVRYYLVNNNNHFQIDSNTGEISARKPLSDAIGMHRINIRATDGGSPALSSIGVVEILVGNAPGISTLHFSNLTYTVSIDENSPPDTSVVKVTAKFVTGTSSTITYSFANGNGDNSEDNAFTINSDTGFITVNDQSKLDYETAPRMRLIILATANKAYGYTTVWVNLKDKNDNPPRFTQERYTSSVWEGNKRSTYVTQVMASDIDEKANGFVTYRIIGGNTNDAFVIDPPNTGIVQTNIILDREIKSSYRLEIEAYDSGTPQFSSTCFLKISVIDVNDNEPTFPSYGPVNVKEGTELGTNIIHMTANDIDLNPTLTYKFVTDGNPDDTFSIDRYSGQISLAKDLDYERRSRYRLTIEVSDSKNVNTQDLIVQVVDDNDNRPEFTQQSYQVTVKEQTPPHFPIITVNATDKDSGENARITYSMVWLDGFYIDKDTGTIYTNKTMVFNPSQPTVHLVVTAQDHGLRPLSAVMAVKVQTIDINNHAPNFTSSQYSKKISEDGQVGEAIVQVTARDLDDSTDNKRVDYSIIDGNKDNTFRITGSTGEIILNGLLDREVIEVYYLRVMAKDRGVPPLNNTVLVTVQVTDVNDNAPVFNQAEYKVHVNESVPKETPVVRVYADDEDSGDNGLVKYSIVSGNDDDRFGIDETSGWITTTDKLDHETSELNRLIIKATDSSTEMSKLSAFATVIINVTDVNEHRPRFPVMMYLEHVYENENVGTHVFTAHANDQDGRVYGKVQYQLEKDEGIFIINKFSGEVVTAARLDYEAKKKYIFDVLAIDKGGLYNRVPVEVTVDPKDEFRPEFEKEFYNFSVPGNAKKGHFVGRIQATDKDGSSTRNIVYSLEQAHDYFAINDSSGILTVIKDLLKNDDRKKRDVSDDEVRSRQRRALKIDTVDLVVLAKSGAKASSVRVGLNINRTCGGCSVSEIVQPGNLMLSGTALVLVIVFVIIAIVLIIIIVVMYLRGRERKRHPAVHGRFNESLNSIDIQSQSLDIAPPAYNDIPYHHQQHPLNPNNITTSEMSDQSHSASSGRGSAEDAEDEDEEIRMINSTPLRTSALIRSGMPDSGIQHDDDDTKSELSVQNHQEYLARLGIDASKISSSNKCVGVATSVESMHQFSEEGGGECDGLDIENLVYAKLDEVEGDDNMAVIDGTRQYAFNETEPSHAGSLSSVINSEEELSGSYNWDYLLDWGPQYQPLAHVFAEIARLKDDAVQPRKQPTKIIPQNRAINAQNPQVKTFPPPIITNAPPRVAPQTLSSVRSSHSNSTINSGNTSHMTSLPSLPRSPISHESSYTSLALTPSFTPSLSPLATRSPSISPLVSPKGVGSSGPSSGLDTPKGAVSNQSIVGHGLSESEQELHI